MTLLRECYITKILFPSRWCMVVPMEYCTALRKRPGMAEARHSTFNSHSCWWLFPPTLLPVDILQLSQTDKGNSYVVFMDYLTKWPEGCNNCSTICRKHNVCSHGIPEELSDQGPTFLSSLIAETCHLLDVKKINTSGYYSQTDGLEEFNSTLTNMIAKSCEIAMIAIGMCTFRICSLRIGFPLKSQLESLPSLIWMGC